MISKLDELRCVVADVQPEVICVSEAWTNDKHSTAFLNIKGYILVGRRDREDTSAGFGGGLLIYVKNGIAAPENRKPEFREFNQSCCIKLPLYGGRHLDLLLVYRPHKLYDPGAVHSDVRDNNSLLGGLFATVQKPSVILGDFNCSDIDWEAATSGSQSEFLVKAATENGFEQHVNFPTHCSGNSPDLVFSSDSNLITDMQDLGRLANSDHNMILVTISGRLPRKDPTTETIPDWRKADLEGLRQEAASFEWTEELDGLGTEECWTKIKETMNNLQEKYVPLRKRRENNQPVWMDRKLLRTIRKKRRLWKAYTQTDDYRDFTAYKEFEKETTKAVKNAKKKYERKLAKEAKKNPKQFYAYLKSKTSNRESVGPLKKDGSQDFESDDTVMAGMLNEFFSSVFTDEDLGDIPVPDQAYRGNEPLLDIEITDEKVKKKIESLRMGADPGPDGITPRLVKILSDSLTSPLAMLFRRSMSEGVVPEDWRIANVTPIYKKGGKA